MRTIIKFALFVSISLCISSAQALDQMSTDAKQKFTKQQLGSEAAPVFIKKLATDEEKATDDKAETERKKKWEMDVETLKVAKEARVASKDAATYAYYGVLVSLLLAIIAYLQWRMFGKQLGHMKMSNETAAAAAQSALKNIRLTEKQFIASHRPWIKVELTHTGDLNRDSAGGWAILLNFKMTNVGSTPAQNVYPNPEFYAGEGFVDDLKKYQLKIAAEFKSIVDTTIAGLTIFPGDFFTISVFVHITNEVADNKVLTHAVMGFGDCLPRLFIVGSVHYKSTLEELPHRTGFIKAFDYFDARGQTTLIPNQDSISHEKLKISSYISGDGYID
jgi:hypothetical protein